MSPSSSPGGHGGGSATEVPRVPQANAAALLAHYERYFGPPNPVFVHEKESLDVHLDIYFFAPTDDRPFITAATVGMSALPLETSHVCDHCKDHAPVPKYRHELLMYLDPSCDFNDLNNRYPLLMMNYVARQPHIDGRPFAWGTSYDFPEEIIPEGSLLAHGYVMRPAFELLWAGADEFDEFAQLDLPESDEQCQLNYLVPITRAECYVKRTEGPPALVELLLDNTYLVLDVDRQCFVEYENRAQRRARQKAQRNRAKRQPATPLANLTCECHGPQ